MQTFLLDSAQNPGGIGAQFPDECDMSAGTEKMPGNAGPGTPDAAAQITLLNQTGDDFIDRDFADLEFFRQKIFRRKFSAGRVAVFLQPFFQSSVNIFSR